MTRIVVTCPASCGELFQGVTDRGEYLLSYGIERRVEVSLSPRGKKLSLLPEKMQKALSLTDIPNALSLLHERNFSISKGYSSSTADLVACLQAAYVHQGQAATAEYLTKKCARIEPTDSVAFADWTVIDPLTGEVLYQTNWKPELYVYILEPVYTVETSALERMIDSALYKRKQSAQLFERFQDACENQDLSLVGQLATQSALLNQQRLPKPYLIEVLSLAEKYGSIGLNVAHSGSVIGLLFGKDSFENIHLLEKSLQDSPIGNYYQKRFLSNIIYEGVCLRREA